MKKAQLNEALTDSAAGGLGAAATQKGQGLSRRRMIRGAAAAVPTILTLHSGAALARTSNLISRAEGIPVDAQGNAMCLDESSVAEILEGGRRYDLGDPINANVTDISTIDGRRYYATEDLSGAPLTPQEMCERGDVFYYEGSEVSAIGAQERADLIRQSFLPADAGEKAVQSVTVPRGGLVSATALASFIGRGVTRYSI